MSTKEERLREQIDARGVSELARSLGVARNTLYNWCEKGNVPLDKLYALGEAGVDVAYVLTGRRLSAAREAEGSYMIRANAEREARGEPPIPGLVEALQGLADTDRRIAARAESMALVNHYLSALDDDAFTAALDMLMRYGLLLPDDRLAVNRMVDGLAAARR